MLEDITLEQATNMKFQAFWQMFLHTLDCEKCDRGEYCPERAALSHLKRKWERRETIKLYEQEQA